MSNETAVKERVNYYELNQDAQCKAFDYIDNEVLSYIPPEELMRLTDELRERYLTCDERKQNGISEINESLLSLSTNFTCGLSKFLKGAVRLDSQKENGLKEAV